MNDQNYKTAITTGKNPKQVFDAINHPSAWWSEEITGGTENLNDEFSYHFRDVHICRIKLAEVVPEKKVVWQVLENYFNFVRDQDEWKNTQVIFEITEEDGKTRVDFTHLGLVPGMECYSICQDAWTGYITGSLKDLIVTGKGHPNPKES